MEGHITFTTHKTKEVIINTTEITWVADPINQERMLEKSHSNKTASHLKSRKICFDTKIAAVASIFHIYTGYHSHY